MRTPGFSTCYLDRFTTHTYNSPSPAQGQVFLCRSTIAVVLIKYK
jgi:hypothetical protein